MAQEQAQPQIKEEELSENQKRKRETQRLKKEAEEKAKREEEERIKQEKLRKQREREEKETEQRRLKTEALFRGLAAANQVGEEKKSVQASNFEDVMQEQAQRSQRQIAEDQRIENARVAQNTNMKFNYIGKANMPVAKGTIAEQAAKSAPDFGNIANKNKRKK